MMNRRNGPGKAAGGEMEKRLRETTWEDYGISKNRYNELKAFCLQYWEKKEAIDRIKGNAGSGAAGGSPGNPTQSMAIRNVQYQSDCEMIENAAISASAEIYPYILESVTRDLSFRNIEFNKTFGRIPVGKTEFYALRRKFYYILHLKKLGTKSG